MFKTGWDLSLWKSYVSFVFLNQFSFKHSVFGRCLVFDFVRVICTNDIRVIVISDIR